MNNAPTPVVIGPFSIVYSAPGHCGALLENAPVLVEHLDSAVVQILPPQPIPLCLSYWDLCGDGRPPEPQQWAKLCASAARGATVICPPLDEYEILADTKVVSLPTVLVPHPNVALQSW